MSYGTSQGPAGRIRGPAGRISGPVGRIRALWDGLGPAGPTWAPQDDQDTGTDRAPRDEPGPRITNHSLLDTIRVLVDEPEHR